MNAILQRLGGGDADPELLQSFLGPALPPELLDAVEFLAQKDGAKLVTYAFRRPVEGDRFLREYLQLHTFYLYDYYRNRSLWVLLGWVLRHPNQDWTRTWVRELAQAALITSSPHFREAFGLAVLGLQAHAGVPDVVGRLDTIRRKAEGAVRRAAEAAESSEIRGLGDSWGFLRRRLAALAEVHALVVEEAALARDLLSRALRPLGGFAGFRAPALMALPEAVQIVAAKDTVRWIDQSLEDALHAAHNIQDGRFCAIATSRVHAMRRRWWPSPANWGEVIRRFLSDPGTAEFAALHIVGEAYEWRRSGPIKLELPSELRHADTLRALAREYQRPLSAFEQINPGREPGRAIAAGEAVNVPDPGFASMLASRFAAGVLSDANLSQKKKVRLVQALVPATSLNPTAMDAVLSRLLLAARPADVATIEDLEVLTRRFGIMQ
jgi:hypothetical protein